MNKILFISDIHGNIPAVKAMEQEIAGIKPDKIIFLGDAVGKGPESDKAVDWVRDYCDLVIKGNWDSDVYHTMKTGEYPWNRFYVNQLGQERLEWLNSLASEAEIQISGLWFRLLHGRPLDHIYMDYDNWDVLKDGFNAKTSSRKYDGFICADCHSPFVRTNGLGYVLNSGSIGNTIGVPRATGLLIEGELDSSDKAPIHFDILSVPYDNQAASDIADKYPELPGLASYKQEVMTGVYSPRHP